MAIQGAPAEKPTRKANDADAVKRSDGVARKGDRMDDGVQIGALYVYRVSEDGNIDPGVEKDRNQQLRTHCGMTAVQGYLLNVREAPSRFKDSKSDVFEMLEIQLTQKAYGIREADSEGTADARLLEPGAVVLVPVNHSLKDLVQYAAHATHTIEVKIVPGDKSKKKTAAGFYPRNWNVFIMNDGKLVERSSLRLAALPALPSSSLPALPAGDDDLPG